jgi:plastocyanin
LPYDGSMGRLVLISVAIAAAMLTAPLAALAGYGQPSPPPGSGPPSSDRSVEAQGNPFSGGLAFDPARVKAKVGQSVSWTNTDSFVPHTATEDHRLWRLAGDYGPPGTMGIAPGQSVQRRFAAGTWSYFCEIHPTQMHGTVVVPVTLRSTPARRGGNGVVKAIWSRLALPGGQVFDVQERIGAGPWRTVRNGVRGLEGSFAARSGKLLGFRARVREKSDPSAASGYSPPARLRVG